MIRRLISTNVRIAKQGTVETIIKQRGESCAFGEVVAFLKDVDGNPLAVTSPVHGYIVKINASVGDAIHADSEFAVFNGRKPLIQFTHLKGPLQKSKFQTSHGNTAQVVSSPEKKSAPSPSKLFDHPSSTSEFSKKGVKITSVEERNFMNLPPNFRRLPPLNEKEASLLHSGLAYDS